jgi:hypothetical protein
MNKKFIAMIFVCALFFIPMASAMDWDNIKEFEPNGDYGTIKVYNSWLIPNVIKGDILGEYTLVENTDQCLADCYAEGTAILHEADALFDEYDFTDRKGSKRDINYNIYTEVADSVDVEVPVFVESCITEDRGNGTTEYCEQVQDGTTTEERITYDWKKYTGQILPAGSYKWRLESKGKNVGVDWAVGFMGISTDSVRENWAWWDSDWTKKREIDIEESTGNTWGNYSVLLSLTYDADMNTDFSDLRFVDSTETEELGYWIESKVDSTSAEVWVKTSLAASTNTSIYMYYGNAGASSTNKGENAFIWFDNATTDTSSAYSCNADTSIAYAGGGLQVTKSGGFWDSCWKTTAPNVANFSLTSTVVSCGGSGAYCGISGRDAKSDTANRYREVWFTGNTIRLSKDIGGVETHLITTGSTVFGAGSVTLRMFDDNLTSTWNGVVQTSTQSQLSTGVMGLMAYDTTTVGTYKDIIGREFSNPEPIYSLGAETENTGATATLSSPIAYYNTTDTTPDLLCNFTGLGTTNISNVTINVYDSSDNLDYSNTDLTPAGLVKSYNKTWTTTALTDDVYNWSCSVLGDSSEAAVTANRTITIDTTAPTINITYPLNGSTILTATVPYNTSFNSSISDTYLSTCWYFNGTANNTVTCGENATIFLGAGEHTLYWYANDTVGNEGSAQSVFTINYYYENATYTDPAVELETYDYNLTVTANTITAFNGTLYYNGTVQPTTYSNNDTVGTLNSTFSTALVGNNSINWIYYINGVMVNTTYSNIIYQVQNLAVVAGESCAAGLSPALHYDLQTEQNSTNVSAVNDYIFRYGITNTSLRTTAGSVTANNFTVCINSTVYNNYGLGYGEIQYQSSGYSDRRFYMFNNQRLSNTTINNTLYNLIGGSSTSFLFTIQKSDLSVYDDVYLTLNRWYPEEDEYKVVEMSRTDDEGQTVMKVDIEDVDYRVGVYYQNGTLIYLAAPFRLVCIASPCTYDLKVPEDAGNTFENWKNLQVSLTYNTTTKIFTAIYNDPSQDTDTINLSVYRDTGLSSLLICSDSASSYTGVLTCNVTGYTGLLKAQVFRTASPLTAVISKWVTVGASELGSTPALFLTMLIMIFLVSVGIVSPILTVILSVLAFIPALIFGILPLQILLIIGAMGFIVIHFIKRSKG